MNAMQRMRSAFEKVLEIYAIPLRHTLAAAIGIVEDASIGTMGQHGGLAIRFNAGYVDGETDKTLYELVRHEVQHRLVQMNQRGTSLAQDVMVNEIVCSEGGATSAEAQRAMMNAVPSVKKVRPSVILRQIEEAGTPAEGVQDWRVLETAEDWAALEKELSATGLHAFEPKPTKFPCFVLAAAPLYDGSMCQTGYEMAILTFNDADLMLHKMGLTIHDEDDL